MINTTINSVVFLIIAILTDDKYLYIIVTNNTLLLAFLMLTLMRNDKDGETYVTDSNQSKRNSKECLKYDILQS